MQLVKDNSVVASYTYDAFGNLTSQIGESDNPFLYCGEYFDAETQTYYLRARYYNPANGRFTQQDAWSFMDASDPLSLNLYTYCCNNPVMYVDPSGQFGVITTILAGATLISIMFLSGCANTIDNVPKDTTVFVASAEASPQPLTPIPEPVKEMTEEELAEQLAVAQTIYGEAGGSKKYPNEWKQGQEAVAWTIINRVQSSKYPDNPLQVVTAEGQFTGYMTGKKTYEAGACDEESWQYAYTLAEYIVKCAYHNIPYPAGFTNEHFEFRAEVGQDHRSMGRSGMVTYGGNTFFSTGGGR